MFFWVFFPSVLVFSVCVVSYSCLFYYVFLVLCVFVCSFYFFFCSFSTFFSVLSFVSCFFLFLFFLPRVCVLSYSCLFDSLFCVSCVSTCVLFGVFRFISLSILSFVSPMFPLCYLFLSVLHSLFIFCFYSICHCSLSVL